MIRKTNRIKLLLKSFDHKALHNAAVKVLSICKSSGASVTGPIPLPVINNKFAVVRSPHIDKESGEKFKLSTHRLLMYIDNAANAMGAFGDAELPSGVHLEVKSE